MEIRWTDRVRNEVLHRVEEINILHTRKRMKPNWVVHILRRKCLLKHVNERKIEGTIEVGGIDEEDVSNYRMILS